VEGKRKEWQEEGRERDVEGIKGRKWANGEKCMAAENVCFIGFRGMVYVRLAVRLIVRLSLRWSSTLTG